MSITLILLPLESSNLTRFLHSPVADNICVEKINYVSEVTIHFVKGPQQLIQKTRVGFWFMVIFRHFEFHIGQPSIN